MSMWKDYRILLVLRTALGLECKFKIEGIRLAIFHMEENNTPGPHHYTMDF